MWVDSYITEYNKDKVVVKMQKTSQFGIEMSFIASINKLINQAFE